MPSYTYLLRFVLLSGVVLRTLAFRFTHPYFVNTTSTEKLRCNCKPNSQCGDNGRCSPNVCAPSFMGVNCQHVSIDLHATLQLKNQISTNVPSELTDGNVSTCLKTGRVTQKFYYVLNKPKHFIWIYFSRRSAHHMRPRLVLFNDKKKLEVNPYFMNIDDRSLLIKIRQNVLYNKLELSTLPRDLCSLEVSAGRNVALYSDPDQSSVYKKSKLTPKLNAASAVDGNDNQSYSFPVDTHCMHTQMPPGKHEWWRTTLKYDAFVNTVVIVNRIVQRCRLNNFTLKAYTRNKKSSPVFTHVDNSTVERPFLVVHVGVHDLIRTVEVSVSRSSTSSCADHGILTICEMYIFGEFCCPGHYYGPLCERDCPRCSRDRCDPDWGCLRGCQEGWTGPWCGTQFNSTVYQTGPVTDLSGTTKTLSCTPRPGSLDNLGIKFYKNGLDLNLQQHGHSGTILILKNTTTSDSGSYSCSFQDKRYTSTPIPVEINFIDKPVFSLEIYASMNEELLEMNCTSGANTGVSLHYTFKKDGRDISNATYITDPKLRVHARDLNPPIGNYTCAVTAAGATFAASAAVQLIHTNIHLPGPMTDISGRHKTLTCTTNTLLGKLNTHSTLFYKNGAVVKIEKSTDKLTLLNTTPSDSGSYSCRVVGHNFLSARSLPVDINFIDKPVLDIKLSVPVYDVQMDMHCNTSAATGVNVTYTFKTNGAVIMDAADLSESTFSVLVRALKQFLGESSPFESSHTCEVTAAGQTFVSDEYVYPQNYSIPEDKCFFKHGPFCEFFCAPQCAGLGDCDSRTEECTEGCKPGFMPPKCESRCPAGMFGQNCSEQCFYCTESEATNQYLCHHITGKCVYSCAPGYYEKYCETLNITDSINPMIYIKYGLVCLVVVILLFWKYRFYHVLQATVTPRPSISPSPSDDDVQTVIRDRVVTHTTVSEYVQDTPVDPDSSVDPAVRAKAGRVFKFQSEVDPRTKHHKYSVVESKTSSIDPNRARQKKVSIFQKVPKYPPEYVDWE